MWWDNPRCAQEGSERVAGGDDERWTGPQAEGPRTHVKESELNPLGIGDSLIDYKLGVM